MNADINRRQQETEIPEWMTKGKTHWFKKTHKKEPPQTVHTDKMLSDVEKN